MMSVLPMCELLFRGRPERAKDMSTLFQLVCQCFHRVCRKTDSLVEECNTGDSQ